MAAYEDDEYEIPLRDQPYFGAGIKRKRVKFVSSSTTESQVQSSPATPSQSAADAYLSIVFKKDRPVDRSSSAPPVDRTTDATIPDGATPSPLDEHEDGASNASQTCNICNRRTESETSAIAHESSIAHQICLEHSHPPSHLDRRRKGLTVLESHGWDPDSRKGLGTEGDGILYPIKAKENPPRAGLGLDPRSRQAVEVARAPKLDAGKIKDLDTQGKKQAQKLRDAFYRSEDVEKYLGVEGATNMSLDVSAFKKAKRRR